MSIPSRIDAFLNLGQNPGQCPPASMRVSSRLSRVYPNLAKTLDAANALFMRVLKNLSKVYCFLEINKEIILCSTILKGGEIFI